MYIPSMQATTSFTVPSFVKMLCDITDAQVSDVLASDFKVYQEPKAMFNLVDGPRLYVVLLQLGRLVVDPGTATIISRDSEGFKMLVVDIIPSTSSYPEVTISTLRELFTDIHYTQEASDEMARLLDWSAANAGFPTHVGTVTADPKFSINLFYKSEHTHVGGRPYKIIMFRVSQHPNADLDGVYTAMFPVFKAPDNDVIVSAHAWRETMALYRAGRYHDFLYAVRHFYDTREITGYRHHRLEAGCDYVVCLTQPKVNNAPDPDFDSMGLYSVHGMRVAEHKHTNQYEEESVSTTPMFTVVNEVGDLVERKASHFVKVLP